MQTTAAIIVLLAAASGGASVDPAAVARMPSAAALGGHHELLASEPHVAGTPGDARTIERLVAQFRAMGEGLEGWEVEVHEFFPLLARPVKARLEIVGVEDPAAGAGARRGVLSLGVTEPNLAIDPATAHPDLDIAWNAYSGSGLVESEVVYVNYGRREDFLKLKELGVATRGKIALARYGGNFRGYKAKFAEEAGCAGLVIFTDPADSGFTRGKTWPDGGGWANPECIQRGSLTTLGYSGDPLTPFREATKDAARLDADAIALPRIPVQPIGYGAAQQILVRMKGPDAPADWKGGLPCPYPLEGGPLRLRLEVEQRREIARTANVVARLRGATRPDEEIIVGAHHDAWCFGAADPLAGTICMLESARNFTELARAGARPDRSLVFAAWGAEEYGIIGSSEFVERDAAGLARRAVCYINLDMAAMGLRPGAGVSPTLRPAIARALAGAPGVADGSTALEVWGKNEAGEPAFGDLGGGSDHVGFWCHAGIPSIALSSGGSAGTSYHSNYDTVAWYRSVVGADYQAARLVTGIVNAIVATLADDAEHGIAPLALVADAERQLAALRDLAAKRGVDAAPLVALGGAFASLGPIARAAEARMAATPRADDRDRLQALLSAWVCEQGLPGRPWFRNLYAATDRHSGYGSSLWPALREAVEDGDPAAIASASERYLKVAEGLRATLESLAAPR